MGYIDNFPSYLFFCPFLPISDRIIHGGLSGTLIIKAACQRLLMDCQHASSQVGGQLAVTPRAGYCGLLLAGILGGWGGVGMMGEGWSCRRWKIN